MSYEINDNYNIFVYFLQIILIIIELKSLMHHKLFIIMSMFVLIKNLIIYHHIILFLYYKIKMIIEVQHCVDCHLHNWCSRHNEAKYHEFYQQLECKVRSAFKRVDIIKNNPPKHFQQRNISKTVGLQLHNYFDQQKN